MKIEVKVDTASSIAAGYDPSPAVLEITQEVIAALSAEDRAAVSAAVVSDSDGDGSTFRCSERLATPTLDALLTAGRKRLAAKVADEQKVEACKELAERNALAWMALSFDDAVGAAMGQLSDWRIERIMYSAVPGYPVTTDHRSIYSSTEFAKAYDGVPGMRDFKARVSKVMNESALQEAEAKKQEAEAKKQEAEAKKQEAEAKKQEAEAKLREWVVTRGTEQATLLLEEGHAAWKKVAASAFITAHTPEGYEPKSQFGSSPKYYDISDRTTPTADDIRALRKARAICEASGGVLTDPELCYVKTFRDSTEDDDPEDVYSFDDTVDVCQLAAVRVTVIAPTGESKDVYRRV